MSDPIKQFTKAARAARESAHADQQPFIPTMQFALNNEVLGFVMMPPFGTEREKFDSFMNSLFMTQTFKDFDVVYTAMDAFWRRASRDEMDEDGNFTGTMPSEDPTSKEAIIIMKYTRDRHDEMFVHTYEYTQDGIEWHEVEEIPVEEASQVVGWMHDAVHSILDNGVTHPMEKLDYVEFMAQKGGAPAYPMEDVEKAIVDRIIAEAFEQEEPE